MPKETFYFSHDYNSRSDKELIKVIMKMGMAGVGIYWCIVEMLYEEGGYLMRTEYERIAFELRTHIDSIAQLVESFNLFKYDDEKFWSNSVLNRINKRNLKSVKARESAKYRWPDANALQTHSDRNAIKERKGKEINKNIAQNKFNTTPIRKDFNGLPEIKSIAAIELISITKYADVSKEQIKRLWEVFKEQNLTGEKYYKNEDAVYSHFINWAKDQKFNKKINFAKEDKLPNGIEAAKKYS